MTNWHHRCAEPGCPKQAVPGGDWRCPEHTKRQVNAAEYTKTVLLEVGRQLMQRLADPTEGQLLEDVNQELARYGLHLERVRKEGES